VANRAPEAQHVGLGCIIYCHAGAGLECSERRKEHDLAALARHHLIFMMPSTISVSLRSLRSRERHAAEE